MYRSRKSPLPSALLVAMLDMSRLASAHAQGLPAVWFIRRLSSSRPPTL